MDYAAEHGYDFKHSFLDKRPSLGSGACSDPVESMVLTGWMEHVRCLRNRLSASLDALIDTCCEARPSFITRVRMRVVRAYI